jgi:glycosyltransferase involved in cell wall biosynthesis
MADTGPPLACIVVPCFNEARRLDEEALLGLVADGSVRLLLVDDGSTDDTLATLDRLASTDEGITVLALASNQGKAEAVRRGLQAALAGPSPLVGYYDADLATPPGELLRLVDTIRARPDVECVLGARVALLGTDIERRATRHYTGRVFATAAAIALGIRVYDTQCGAKVFRRSDALIAATNRPFRSRWAFDVELLSRLLRGGRGIDPMPASALLEVPLRSWRDVPGSRLGTSGVVLAVVGVVRMAVARRWAMRRGHAATPPAGR